MAQATSIVDDMVAIRDLAAGILPELRGEPRLDATGHNVVVDEYRLTGSRLDRARQALRIARQQLAAAETDHYPNEAIDALGTAEDTIGDAIYRIEDAADAAAAACAERQGVKPDGAWYPAYCNAA